MLKLAVTIIGWFGLIALLVFGVGLITLLFAWYIDERIKKDSLKAMRKYG